MVDEDLKDKDKDKDSQIKLGETLKKVLAAGVSAAFMTEESVRAYLAELKVPKEILNLLIQGAAKSKEEITQRVTQEIIGIIRKVDFVKEFSRFAEDHKFKISAEVEIIKKKQTSSPIETKR